MMNEAPEAHFDSPVNDFEEQIQEVRFMYRKRYTKWYLETAEGRPYDRSGQSNIH